MKQKSKTYSFSAVDTDLVWLEGLRERLQGKISFSQAILEGLKCKFEAKGKSKIRIDFEDYCLSNDITEDQQLLLLMTTHRVSNSLELDHSADKEVNFYAAE